jgi:hypothetical protein
VSDPGKADMLAPAQAMFAYRNGLWMYDGLTRLQSTADTWEKVIKEQENVPYRIVLLDDGLPSVRPEIRIKLGIPQNEFKLALLRIQLFTAIQELKGDDLAQFWHLIAEVTLTRSPE